MEIMFEYLFLFPSQFWRQSLKEPKEKCSDHSLGSVDGFGIKVTLCIHCHLFLQCCSKTDIHKVRGQGPGDGTQARIGHLEQFSIIFLQQRQTQQSGGGGGVSPFSL